MNLKSLIRALIKESSEPSIGGSYADQQTVVGGASYVKPERDPLTDPLLTGKLTEGKYRFDDFKWLGSMNGFDVPSDVYFGSIMLGVIASTPEGYIIKAVMGPKGTILIRKSKKNLFKTKDEAAEILHRTWAQARNTKL